MTEYGYIYRADFDEKRVCIFDIIPESGHHYDNCGYSVFDTFMTAPGGQNKFTGKQYLYSETDDRVWYCGLDDPIPAERL